MPLVQKDPEIRRLVQLSLTQSLNINQAIMTPPPGGIEEK